LNGPSSHKYLRGKAKKNLEQLPKVLYSYLFLIAYSAVSFLAGFAGALALAAAGLAFVDVVFLAVVALEVVVAFLAVVAAFFAGAFLPAIFSGTSLTSSVIFSFTFLATMGALYVAGFFFLLFLP
jgi:hypothetical protein